MRACIYPFCISLLLLTACSNQPEPLPDTSEPTASAIYPQGPEKPNLSELELQKISERIYFNETAAQAENLLKWNDNENFVSLGIGHFIWYPQGVTNKRFDETFPHLLDHLQENGVIMPFWLQSARHTGAPWTNKAALTAALNDPEVRELRRILLSTMELQTLFFLKRINLAIPQIVEQVPSKKRQHIINNYNAIANTENGWYPLIDYLNFKGSGLKQTERYNGYGWGLAQVLEEMKVVKPGSQALDEFTRTATKVLQRRIDNSPEENDEHRWLAGWKKRIGTYAQPY